MYIIAQPGGEIARCRYTTTYLYALLVVDHIRLSLWCCSCDVMTDFAQCRTARTTQDLLQSGDLVRTPRELDQLDRLDQRNALNRSRLGHENRHTPLFATIPSSASSPPRGEGVVDLVSQIYHVGWDPSGSASVFRIESLTSRWFEEHTPLWSDHTTASVFGSLV
jgi:hypothetical protein